MRSLAQGREAEIYVWAPDRVLRLAYPGMEDGLLQSTAALEAAGAAGAAVPAVHERVTIEGRSGVVLDRCPGQDLLQLVQRRPLAVWKVGRTLGRFHATLHEIAATEGLPTTHEMLRERLEADTVPAAVRASALAQLALLPDGEQLCHGDFHPANVMLARGGGMQAIDWTLGSRGTPEADIARTILILSTAEVPGEQSPFFRRVDAVGRRILLLTYLASYGRRRAIDRAEVERWMPVCVAARLAEDVPESERSLVLRQAQSDDPARLTPQPMDRRHRQWVWLNAIVITAVINVIANAVIAWVSVLGMDDVPLWSVPLIGGTSTAVDTVGTFFVLPFLTMMFTSLAIHREIRRGAFPPIAAVDDRVPLMWLLPERMFRRALTFAAVCLVVLSPPALLALVVIDPGTISTSAFITYKIVLGVALGALVTPVIAIGAMATRRH